MDITKFFKTASKTSSNGTKTSDIPKRVSSSEPSQPHRPSKRPRPDASTSNNNNDPINTFDSENVDPHGVRLTSPPPRLGRLQRQAAQISSSSSSSSSMQQQTLTSYIKKQIQPTRRSRMAIWSSSYKALLPAFARQTMGAFSLRSMDRKHALMYSLSRYSVDWSCYGGAPELDVFARVHTYVRSPRNYPSRDMAFTSMAFDNDGVLLVASDPRGGFRIFDFDTYLQASLVHGNRKSRRGRATVDMMLPTSTNSTGSNCAVKIAPIHCVETEQQCQQIVWHPTNPNYVVAAYRTTDDVHLFDLSKFPQTPKAVFCATKKNTSGGGGRRGGRGGRGGRGKVGSCGVLCFDAFAGTQRGGSGNQIAAAGGDVGIVRVWDTRISSAPVYNIKSRNGSKIHALCYSDTSALLYYGDNEGRIVAHDMRKTEVPAFSLKSVPKKCATYDTHLPGESTLISQLASRPSHVRRALKSRIVSLVSDPSHTGHVTFRTSLGLVGIVDASRANNGAVSSSSTSATSSSSTSSTSSLRLVGWCEAAIDVPVRAATNGADDIPRSITAQQTTVAPSNTSSRYQQARVGLYDDTTNNVNVSSSSLVAADSNRRPSPATAPYYAMQYMGGGRGNVDPVLCIGAKNSCTLHLIPVDGKIIRVSHTRRRGLRGKNNNRESATEQLEQFLNAARGTRPGDVAAALMHSSTTSFPSSSSSSSSHTRMLQECKTVVLEEGGRQGGGVRAIACHQQTGHIVAALDNGKCVAATQ